MVDYTELITAGTKLGYQGERLQQFIDDAIDREERLAERNLAKEAKQREHDITRLKLELEVAKAGGNSDGKTGVTRKLILP